MRAYQFNASEMVYDDKGNLDLSRDPKETWALSHPEFFPVRINKGDKEALLRVPGLGPISVERILLARKNFRIRALEDIGIRGKLARKAFSYLDFS